MLDTGFPDCWELNERNEMGMQTGVSHELMLGCDYMGLMVAGVYAVVGGLVRNGVRCISVA